MEIEPFDGSPEHFRRFYIPFNFHVSCKVASNKQRFSYILHYCQWVTKDAIRHCALLPKESPPLVIFKGMTKGRVNRELRQADYNVDLVVCTVQKSAWIDEATSL